MHINRVLFITALTHWLKHSVQVNRQPEAKNFLQSQEGYSIQAEIKDNIIHCTTSKSPCSTCILHKTNSEHGKGGKIKGSVEGKYGNCHL